MRRSTAFLTMFALLSFAPLAFAEDECICTAIKVRNATDKTALGPDGDGKKGWPPDKDKTDGKHLGPLNDDPDNPVDAQQ
jgi:hypothetical protein